MFAPACVCDIWIRSSASPSPVRSRTASRRAALVGRVLEPADVERDERERRSVAVERREDRGGRGRTDGAPPRRRRASPHPMSASRSRPAVSRRGVRRRSCSAWSEMSARSCLDLPCGLRCGRGPAAPAAGRSRRSATTSRAIVPPNAKASSRAAVCGQRARDEAAEGRPAHEGEEVEARRAPAQVLRCGELSSVASALEPQST